MLVEDAASDRVTTVRRAAGWSRPRATMLIVYAVAAACFLAIRFATNGVLGFHIDELYYMTSGRHPAFGYVDYPPIVPLLARLETGLLGVTPWTLRLLPALVGAVNVILCGAYVRKLGGSLGLQALALLIGVTEPILLGTYLFQTVVFDQLAWMLSLYWFLSLIIDRKPRYWILLGLTLGIGLEIKYLILPLIAGIAVAVLVTPSLRKDLRTRDPWIGAALMVLIWLPNVVWQISNGFPTLTYVLNHQGDISSGGGAVNFLVYFLILLFLLTPLWIAGLISLFRTRDLRPIGIACVVPLMVYLLVGKFYYPAPTIPIVMAVGLIALSRIQRPRLRSALAIAIVLAKSHRFAGPREDHNSEHATGSASCNRPRYPRYRFREYGGLEGDHQPDDGDLSSAPSIRACVDRDRFLRLWRHRCAANLWQPRASAGELQSAVERLLLAAETGACNSCAHGWVSAFGPCVDVLGREGGCASDGSLSGREPRAGSTRHVVHTQGAIARGLGTTAELLVARNELVANGRHMRAEWH